MRTGSRPWLSFIPVGLFLLLHTGTLIWFLASTNTTLHFLAEQVGEIKRELSLLRAAEAQAAVAASRLDELAGRVESLESSRR